MADMKKIGAGSVVALFMLFLWAPIIQMTFNIFPESRGNENRILAQMPALKGLSLRALTDYKKGFERYFDDRFGFRNKLVRLNGIAHVRLIGMSPTRKVVLGKNGWLFYDDPTDGVNLKDYAGKANFTEEEVRRIKENTLRLNERLKAKNIHLMIVIAPNKHTVYSENLPLSIRCRGCGMTRITQVRDCLAASGIDVVDLRQKLLSSKYQYTYPLYLLTDTHWNSLGAFLGYEEIMKRIRSLNPVVTPMKVSNFALRSCVNGGLGDLAGFINMEGSMFDKEIILEPQIPMKAKPAPAPYESIEGRKSIAAQTDNKRLPKLVMFMDSFAERLIPYLSENFSRSVYVWKPAIDFSVIEREKPDIVIFEVVERKLGCLLSL